MISPESSFRDGVRWYSGILGLAFFAFDATLPLEGAARFILASFTAADDPFLALDVGDIAVVAFVDAQA